MNDEDVTTVLRVDSTSELVAGLPALFGFTPRESLVVLSLSGQHDRIGFRLRHDLVPAEDVTELARQLVSMLLRNDATTVLIVGCSADPGVCDLNVRALRAVLAGARIEVRDAVRCDGERWWSYTCRQPCCPVEGIPYDSLSSRIRAEAVGLGMAIVPERADLALRVAPVSGAQEQAMLAATDDALADIARRLALAARRRGGGVDRQLVEHGVARVKQVLGAALTGVPVSDEDAAVLSTWCRLVPVRDIAWAQVTRANAAAHLDVWSQVARKVVPPWEPAVLSLTGFCAWLSGDGALAWCALDRVELAAPDYSMAELVRQTLRHGLSPDTWVPVPEDLVWDAVDG